MNDTRARRRAGTLGMLLGVWLVLAVGVAGGGLLARSPVPPPAIAFLLTAAALVLLRLSPALRDQARSVGAGRLIVFHLVRLVAGAYFLVLYNRGVLPAEFAVPAGWGDIVVGVGAIAVLWLCIPMRTTARRNALQLWNALGLIDILFVLGNAVRLYLADPAMVAPFTTFPLALLPTFVVPLVIVSHVLLFAWYRDVEGEGVA